MPRLLLLVVVLGFVLVAESLKCCYGRYATDPNCAKESNVDCGRPQICMIEERSINGSLYFQVCQRGEVGCTQTNGLWRCFCDTDYCNNKLPPDGVNGTTTMPPPSTESEPKKQSGLLAMFFGLFGFVAVNT